MAEFFIIDGQQVEFEPGMTILQAALRAGIDIPNLCYQSQLPHPQASCRVCVVEVEGAKSLVASCAFPAGKGLVVHTASERARTSQRMALELMLSDHPADCLSCEEAGACRLQEWAYKLGAKADVYPGEKHQRPVDDSNPFFARDYNKCISCGNCVQACCEVECDDAITEAYRGFDAHPACPFDVPLQESTCTFCGCCVQVCPTGALVDHSRKSQGREWELSKTVTICPYCGCGCSLELRVKNGKVINSRGYEGSPVNQGWLCVKGRYGMEFINSPDRLLKPLIATGKNPDGEGNNFREATWEEALALVAKRLGETKVKSGSDSLAFLASAKCTNEENYLLQKFARAVMGTNNVDHCARLCHASTVAGLAMAFGSGAMTNSIADMAKADCIFIIGSNTTEAHPIIALGLKQAARRQEAKIILADPRGIPISNFASLWLRQRPGTDVALINAMANVILAEGLENKDFIAARTEGFESYKAGLKDCTPEWAEKITGVPAEAIRQAARAYAQAKNAVIVYAMGITQHTTGTENVLDLANLAMLCGQIGREGTGVCPLRGQNNVQGACDWGGLPNVFPGYQKVDDPAAGEKFSQAWGKSLPNKPGLTVVEIMEAAVQGKIQGMLIMGENPAVSDPNLNHVQEALAKVGFLCVMDMFITDTAKYADVILPACSFAEKDGTFTNTERRVQLLRPALPLLGQSLPDWRIIGLLAEKLGYALPYTTTAEIFAEMAGLTPSMAGLSHERIKEVGIPWPCPTPEHPGTPVLHKEKFTRGLGKFHAVPFRPAAELPDAEYPFVFTTGRMLFQYHTGTMTRRNRGIEAYAGKPFVEINPADAEKLGVKDGEPVQLTSRRGTVTVPAKVTDRTAPGILFMTFHFREAAANLLTNDALDPYAKIPEFKVCAVRIAKAAAVA
jgi:formate dehydrogenase (NADP+) alpha subunit